MGIKGAHSLTYSIKIKNLTTLYNVIFQYREDKVLRGINISVNPTIYIDASLVIRSLSCCVRSRVPTLLGICCCLSRTGFTIVIVCDGDIRHHSKRSTTKRIAVSEYNKIEYFKLKTSLQRLRSQITYEDSNVEVAILRLKEKALVSDIRRLNNKLEGVSIDVGNNLFNEIQHQISLLTEIECDSTSSISVRQAQFQADTVLAYAAINHHADLILTSDTDLAALTGVDCVGLKKYKFIDKGAFSNITKCEIFFAFNNTMQKFIQYTHLPHEELSISVPARPIFNDVSNIKIRALYAVLLGCDVTINNFLSCKILEEIIKANYNQHMPLEEYVDIIIQKAFDFRFKVKKSNLPFHSTIDHESFSIMIKILVDAYTMEPANDSTNIYSDLRYLTEETPTSIHPYLQDFIPPTENTSSVPECVELLSCCGIGTYTHPFLRMEGHIKCMTCEKVVCKTCMIKYTNENIDHTYCTLCYGSEFTGTEETITQITPLHQMITILHDMGHEVNRSDNQEVVRDIFDFYNGNAENEIFSENMFQEKIKYPIETSNFLDTLTFKCDFDLMEGGSFICNNLLNNTDRIQIIELFAGLVDINFDNKTNNNQIDKLYNVLPKVMVRFAEESRLNNAYRLLRRSIRHANDPMFVPITKATTKIFTHNDTIGLYIQHKVKASMNPQEYNVVVAFTKEDLLSCRCDCRVGCNSSGRSCCVHILPVIYKLTQILYQGLSEHLLVNFQSLNNNIQLDLLTDEIKISLYDNLILLIHSSDNNLQVSIQNKDIKKLLQKYSVGTELPKFALTETNPEMHGLYRYLNLESSVAAAKVVVNHTTELDEELLNRENDNDINMWDNTKITSNTYQNIYITINIFNRLLSRRNRKIDTEFLTSFVGYRLFNERRNKTSREHNNENIVRNAISLASTTHRTPRIRNQPRRTRTRLPENVDEVDLSEPDLIEQEIEINKEVKQKIIHKSCCAAGCKNTSFKNSKLSFTRVPVVSVAKVVKTSTDRHRKLSAKSKFKRKMVLKRLHALDQNHKVFLEYCSEHTTTKQKFQLPFKDINNKIQSFDTVINIPLDVKGSQRVRRSNDIIENNVIRKKRKKAIINENNINHEKHGRRGKLCDVYGCEHRINDINTHFRCVPVRPRPLNISRTNLRNIDRMRYYCRLDYRRRILVNLGLHPNDSRKEIRFCNHHKISTKNIKVSWYTKNNQHKQIVCQMNLPGKTMSSSVILNNNTKKNKGTGMDRLMHRYICQAQREKDNGNVEVAAMLAQSQVFEQNELTLDTVDEFNETLLDSIGLSLPSEKNTLKCDWQGKRNRNKVVLEKVLKATKFRMDTISDDEIKEYTGFSSLAVMMAYIVVLCYADIKLMTTTCSDLSWFEEWLLYLERVWSKSSTRWVDCRRKFSISKRGCRRIMDSKLLLNKTSRRLYPRFATLNEDVIIRREKWSETYGKERRLIMWDNTDITMYKPTQAEAQRLTYSQYYGGNVGKGSVFIQPCGWMGAGEIWTGGVSDSDYMVRSNILKYQQNYLPLFDPAHQDKKWSIILDKGYRITAAAWEAGEQLVIQPAFAQSDKQFTSLQTLRSAAIAADRSGNERAVRYAKMCGYVGGGLRQNASSRRMCDVWLCWSFQCNFMFRPVH